ncbi:hypothetical protein N482_13620 [Pseudoalteromonas luteoviolacea NCIMB 1942]|uniref:Histidine kinase/HSP90-like ATPase domain-containing protein n=1 Tax=Pseudoalteromonas luteoviolacea NCIMB 1942 TaxID=1365253 RepID=A0A167AVP6_9GAMM|nr:hypothetical protein N482_13620 [Pseudoalteromonas luteoviolacea NCIMB 1942]
MDDDGLQLAFSDNGVGMDNEARLHIFEPFLLLPAVRGVSG